MSNTIKATNRTVEISKIDSDYMMPTKLNVQSVVFISGAAFKTTDFVYIVENSVHALNPIKALLTSSIGQAEARAWILNQRLQLGFVFLDGVFNTGSMVIFNLGEIHYGNDVISTQMKMQLSAEDPVL